jgi:PAS domain S-box-containing protein
VLKLLASQAAIALENARLYRDVAEREAKIRGLVDANIIGILISSRTGEIIEANDAFLRMMGYDREDLAAGNMRWTDLTPPEWRTSTASPLEGMDTTGAVQPYETEYVRKDGSRVPVLIGSAGFDEQRDQGVGFVLDLTERKRAEEALRWSEACLAEAQRLSVTGSFGWRVPGNVIVWSNETYRILDVDPAAEPTLELVLGRTHPDDIDLVQRMIERLVNEDRDFDFEYRLLLPDGTIKHLHVRTHRVRFESGEAEVIGALMDVTAARKGEEALRRAQAELVHATRVATLGELSASIAHEVHQPLAAIVASGNAGVRWLDREVPECARAISSVTRMISEAHRASQVILRIRELAKKAEPEMARVDINGLVEDVVTLVHREAVGQRVAVRTQLASELPPARGDRIQLQQVLINLMINGIQAMASVTDRARMLAICTQRRGDEELLVAVEDAGVGIAPENLARLFSAFYTTKPDGMGMGLSISRSIVEAHGGQIWATGNSGPGTTFQFTLSAHREQAAG